jgi:hypothetical protein
MSTDKLARYGLSNDFSDSSVTWPAVKIRAYHNSAEYAGPPRNTRYSFFEVNPKILNKRLGRSKKIMPYKASFVKPQSDAAWEKVTAPFSYQREESLLSPSPSPETNRKVHILMEYNQQNGRKTHVEMEYSTALKALAAKGITHPPKKPSERTPLQPVSGNSKVTKMKPMKRESLFDRPLFDSVVPYGVSLLWMPNRLSSSVRSNTLGRNGTAISTVVLHILSGNHWCLRHHQMLQSQSRTNLHPSFSCRMRSSR